MCVCALHAQLTHVPKSGDVIEFFPVCDSIKALCGGYDCFYETEKAYKNGTIKANPKYRLRRNSLNLTPFDEIENHSFAVEESRKIENPKKAKDNLYVASLTRDDGKKITLVVPFFPLKTSNEITKGMAFQQTKYLGVLLGSQQSAYINLPYIISDSLSYMKSAYENKNLIRIFGKSSSYLGQDIKYNSSGKTINDKQLRFILNRERKLGSTISDSIFYNGSKVHIRKVFYQNRPTYVFKQPMVELERNGQNLYLPIIDYLGKGVDNLYFDYCFFHNYVQEDAALRHVSYTIPTFALGLQKGDSLYYGIGTTLDNKNTYIYKKPSIPYKLNPGYYRFEAYEFPLTRQKLNVNVILRDSLEQLVVVIPTKGGGLDPNEERNRFFYTFCLREDVDSLINVKKRQKLEYEAQVAKAKSEAIQKVGKAYADYYLLLSESEKAKFLIAYKKWGGRIAQDILAHNVNIGWDQEKCRMSWGTPKDINTSIGIWGRHEQWCYDDDSYLYFENGKLTSIQY